MSNHMYMQYNDTWIHPTQPTTYCKFTLALGSVFAYILGVACAVPFVHV